MGKVRWDIVVGVAIPGGTRDPDFFTPEAFPQRLEHTNFIVDAVDMLGTVGTHLDEHLLHLWTEDPLNGHVRVGHRLLAALAMAVEPRQGIDHGLVGRVVRAEG